jgi:tellurite methyltransferase
MMSREAGSFTKTGDVSLELDWDRRYREGLYDDVAEVHGLVERFAYSIPRHKPVIDIAMGQGRDVLFLARAGLRVYGLERSREAIDLARKAARTGGAEIHTVLGDALSLPFRAGTAGAILVFYFLERSILAELVRLLSPGGILLYETFLKRQNALGAGGPRNPDYLLGDGELYECLQDLELLFYEEGIFEGRGKRRALARYAGRKR